MAPKVSGREGISWHDQGPQTVVYQPGPSSLEFLSKQYLRGEDDASDVPFALKLCILLNDALVHREGTFGLDGFFFCSIVAEPLGLGHPTSDEMQEYGPQLFFAQFALSVQDCRAWDSTDLQGKLQLSSFHWKHQALSDLHPVLPIWVPSIPAEGAPHLPSSITTTFSVFKKEEVIGAIAGMVQGRLFLAEAEEFRTRCTEAVHGQLRYDMGESANTQWVQDHAFDGEADQVLQFIDKAHELCEAKWEWMMLYGKARLWGGLVDHKRHVGPRSMLPKQKTAEEGLEEATGAA